MKTRHIIAIGLLSATAIALLGIALAKSNKKPKTLQTNAEDTQITDVTGTTWLFNETIVKENYWHVFNINFTSNNTYYTKLIFQNDDGNEHTQSITYSTPWTRVYEEEEQGWIASTYRTIQIQNGEDVTNTQFIDILYTYATLQYNPYNAGYEAGYTAGESAGYTAGESAGYNNGYAVGYVDAGIYNEVIDLRGTMLQILTMPFTFITQAFDVTIFPNTPYAFNFSRLIMGILAISAILFIIKLFTSGLSILGNYTNNKTDRELKQSQIKLNKAKTDLTNRTKTNNKQ